MIRSCDTCQWWLARGDDEGECRGAPPSVHINFMGDREAIWPLTLREQWCAGWRMADRLIEQTRTRRAAA